MRRLRETQAIAQKRRETPMGRPGRAGRRLCSKWLGRLTPPLRCAVPKLNQEVSRAARVHGGQGGGVARGSTYTRYLPVGEIAEVFFLPCARAPARHCAGGDVSRQSRRGGERMDACSSRRRQSWRHRHADAGFFTWSLLPMEPGSRSHTTRLFCSSIPSTAHAFASALSPLS